MGANRTQAVAIAFMLIAFVLLGCAFAGGGIVVTAGALVLGAVSCYFFRKCKSEEEVNSR